MSETYYAGSYWLKRSESAKACAQRAESFFRFLSRCDSTFTHWFEQAYSREEALKLRFEPDATTFLEMFGRDENQGVKGGFSFGAWNGESSDDASAVRFSCGSSSQIVPSACVLNPPHDGLVADRVLRAPVLTQVLRAMALAWEPEWGIVTSHMHRDQVLRATRVGTFPGWIMYFSHRRGPVPPLPAPVHVEPVEDKGTLIVLTPERFTASNPSHVELASQVAKLLEQAGLLKPLQPWDAPSAPSR